MKSLLEDLILGLSNSTSSAELMQQVPPTALYTRSLETLHRNHAFLKTVMLPLVDKRLREDMNGHIDTNSIAELIDKKISDSYSKYQAKLTAAIVAEVRGVLAAMCRCSLTEKQLDGEEMQHFEDMLDGLRGRGKIEVIRWHYYGV
jgi:hypothetical protein